MATFEYSLNPTKMTNKAVKTPLTTRTAEARDSGFSKFGRTPEGGASPGSSVSSPREVLKDIG